MSPAEQRLTALETANGKRMAQAALRKRLRDGEIRLADVLLDPPIEIANQMLVDVIAWPAHKRAAVSMQHLGKLALRDGVNLLMPVGRASLRSRKWVCAHASSRKMNLR